MKVELFLLLAVLLVAFLQTCNAIWCYQCVSTQPGCGTRLDWLYHWTKVCPENDDICVKILEEKDGSTFITRDCLSSLLAVRKDIPADKYEGCRPAAVDEKLGHYVNKNSSIKELDIYRDHYRNTTWCFCFLDHRCNSGTLMYSSAVVVIFGILVAWL